MSEHRDFVAHVLLLKVEQRGLLVIAVQQEDRRRLRDQAEKRPLQRVARANGFGVHFLHRLDAEVITHADVKIRFVRGSVEQGARVKIRFAHLRSFRMRIALNGKCERAASGTLCVKLAFRANLESGLARLAILQPVEIFGVGLKPIKGQLHWLAGGKGELAGLVAVIARCGAAFKKSFHRLFRQRARPRPTGR